LKKVTGKKARSIWRKVNAEVRDRMMLTQLAGSMAPMSSMAINPPSEEEVRQQVMEEWGIRGFR